MGFTDVTIWNKSIFSVSSVLSVVKVKDFLAIIIFV